MAKVLNIEVGSAEVRVVQLERLGKSSKMHDCFQFATPQGSVEDGHIRDTKTLGDKLRHELQKRHIGAKKVSFTVTSSRIASREVKLPLVKKKQIQSILEANVSDYFPIDLEQYVLSYSIIDIEKEEKKIEVEDKPAMSKEKKKKDEEQGQYHLMVYAAPKSLSASYRELSENAGLKMQCLDYVGDSLYRAVEENFEKGTHVLIKIEEENTIITIVRDRELRLQRSINYGLNQAIEAVSEIPVFGRDLDYNSALVLMLKQNCVRRTLNPDSLIEEPENTSDEMKEARTEVAQNFRYLIGNVSRIMDYYISRNVEDHFDSILCCGTGAYILGLKELMTHELAQDVKQLEELKGYTFADRSNENRLAYFAAVLGTSTTTVNLMERETRKQKENADDLRGALLILGVGAIAAVILAGTSVVSVIYQNRVQERLNARIKQEEPVEVDFNNYNHMLEQYQAFQDMYNYTNTPNEGLVEFLEEMEEKMPSNLTMDNFSSSGTEVSFSLRVASKSEAADTLIQLRTFESLSSVTTTGITETEDGIVSMSVSCTYKDAATLSQSTEG